jgi:hypothetical protein
MTLRQIRTDADYSGSDKTGMTMEALFPAAFSCANPGVLLEALAFDVLLAPDPRSTAGSGILLHSISSFHVALGLNRFTSLVSYPATILDFRNRETTGVVPARKG